MIADPIRIGLARGWKVVDAARLERPHDIACDVAIVGSGAGGGVTAELLAQAGFAVAILEEGPFLSSSDFHMREREAYPQLYQESAGRQTEDREITILHIAQGDLPFGGVGPSGMGEYHGRAGFETFSKRKAVFFQSRFSGLKLFRPPYGPRFEALAKLLFR